MSDEIQHYGHSTYTRGGCLDQIVKLSTLGVLGVETGVKGVIGRQLDLKTKNIMGGGESRCF